MNRGSLLASALLCLVLGAFPAVAADEPIIELFPSGIAEEDVESRPYLDYVIECLDALMEHGTDRYGSRHTPMLVTHLDVATRACPENPPPAACFRGLMRPCFWKPRGSDLLVDQATLRAMYAVSQLTGKREYARFADDYFAFVMKELVDDKGFLWWGWHRFYDVFADERSGSHGLHHEMHTIRPLWDEMWRINPEATRRQIDAIWRWHVVDKTTGEINRHGNGGRGCDFAMAAAEFIYALGFLYAKTGDPHYLEAATLVTNYYWNGRHPKTNLIATRPNAGKNRFDGWHSDTVIPGLHAHFLLKTYETTRQAVFRDVALAYLKAYANYGYDSKTDNFWAGLLLDGTPVPDYREAGGYRDHGPSGYADFWEPYVLGHEHHIYSAQNYAYASQVTGEPFLLQTAIRYAESIDKALDDTTARPGTYYYDRYARHFSPHGTYAGMYGRIISFYLHLYALTKERQYFDMARQVGRTAVSKLYYKGLFRGHPAKRYYGAIDGVGFLLVALIQLDQVGKMPVEEVKPDGIPLPGDADMLGYDNW